MKTKPFIKFFGVITFMLLITDLPAQVKIGDNPLVQNLSAVLELEKADKGLLITRVSLTDIWDDETIPDPANSLLVYNTNFGGGTEPVSPGFYYWREDQGRWIRLRTGSTTGENDVWIDNNENLLSANSANQALLGEHNIVLGYRAFADDAGVTGNMIAIGEGAAQHDTTTGDARNIAIGYQAAFNNGGYDVTFLGRESGMNNTGNNIVGIGDYAGYLNAGNNVIAVGVEPAYGNIGDNVNALGVNACANNTGDGTNAMGSYAANENTQWAVNAFGDGAARSNDGYLVNALGAQSGENNQGNSVNAMGHLSCQQNTGSEVNAFGAMAAQYNIESSVNALGNSAAKNNSGYSVNALGFYSAESNIGANTNAFGASAAQFNQGQWVDAIGQSAAANNSGWYVSAIGYEAAYYNNGSNAVAIGQMALRGNGTIPEGNGNIGIGFEAGMNIGAGANNIAIGYDTQFPDGFASNQINIGNSIIRDQNGVITMNDVIQLPALVTPPASPVAGMIYFDGSMLYCYDGILWQGLW